MNASNTYLTLHGETPVTAELRSPVGHYNLQPIGEVVFGDLTHDARLTLTFTSIEQVTRTLTELAALEGQWRTDIAARHRQADFGDLLPDAATQARAS